MKIGIIYSTTNGHTQKICSAIAKHLQDKEITVEIYPLDSFNQSITDFDVFVIGASIRYGKHKKEVRKFIETHQKELEQIRTGFFSVDLVIHNKKRNTTLTDPYFVKFIKSIKWRPDYIDIFAGYLNYSMYSFFDRIMIKLIMKITKGPTKSDTIIEYTDWNRVRSFSEELVGVNIRTK